MNNKIINAGVWVIVGLVIGMFVLVIISRSNGVSNFGMMGFGQNRFGNELRSNGVSGISSSIDKHFIEQMIPHHDGAIAMANLAFEKSTRPEIRSLSQTILIAQTKENKDMSAWYKDWFGKEVVVSNSAFSGGMMSVGGMHMGGSSDIGNLKSAFDFDKEFIEQMIPHHQMAIMMAQMLKSGTDRAEMLELADNIITSQSKEIEQMRGWYDKWYK